MKKFLAVLLVVPIAFFSAGCPTIEQDAYRTIVGAHAFISSELNKHPECVATATTPAANTPICTTLAKAGAANNALIDAAEVYCAGPDFDTGGACNPPKKGTPAYDQVAAKLKAAMAGYNQAAADLKGVIH